MITNKKPTVVRPHFEKDAESHKNANDVQKEELVNQQVKEELKNDISETSTEKEVIEPATEETKAEDSTETSEVSTDEKSSVLADARKPVEPTVHYFYCKKPDGTEVTYKRSMTTASYATEIISFRKSLADKGIEIISEEQK